MDQTASKKSATMDKTTLKKCILAIDLGSTALRAAFVECEAPYTYHPIQNRDVQANKDAGATVTCMGDFPVSCCPLDPNDPFARIGADAASEPGHVSAKYLMYILANVDESVMADYPLPAELLGFKEDIQLREDCRTILAILFGRLRERVDDYTKRKNMFFDEIILTIPSQWDARFETVYESIITEAFAYDSGEGEKVEKDVHFCGEADALARYIILHEERELEDWEVVLFLDFGGHSMSFATMELKRTKSTGGSGNSSMTFLELDSGGCAGGSEMWSHQVGLLIGKKLKETDVADTDERKKFKLLGDFNTKKIGFMDQITAGNLLPLVCFDEHATLTTVSLPHEEIERCFDTALERPFAMAKEQLKKLKEYSGDKKIGVVVAGGTLQSNKAREAVFANCDIPEERIKYTTEIDVTWLSSCNCHGAALAHAKKMTVAQFFEQGAVIALQKKIGPVHDADWEGVAYLLVGHDKKHVASVYNRYSDTEMKLVCNPNYTQEVTADKNKDGNVGEAGASAGLARNAADNSASNPNTNVLIPIGGCYDLWHLGPQLAGRLTIEASLTSPSGAASSERTLHVSISRKSQRAALGDKVENLPLFLEPGHNAIHVDVDALGPEAANQQAALRQRAEERTRPEEKTEEAPPTERGSVSRPGSSSKSATAKTSRNKRKRKDTNAAPSQPSKRPRTRAERAALAQTSADDELKQLPYYAPPVSRKRKATAPASSTATKKARIATPAPPPKTNSRSDNQSDQVLQGQLHGQPSTQVVSQHNDEDTNVHIDDQLDNELDQNHDPAATASGPPLSPERNSSNNNVNINGSTSRSTRNRTAANARGATATRARSDTPAANADRPATTYTNGRFAPRSSPPTRHQTEPLPEQRGQPQPRRTARQQKGKLPVAALPAATQQQQQQQQPQQPQQPQKGRKDPQTQPQTQPQPQPHPEQEARPQAGPSQVQVQAQAPATAANLDTLKQAVATALEHEAIISLSPRPTRIRQPVASEAPRPTPKQLLAKETQARRERQIRAVGVNRENEEEILDSITVNPDSNRPLADQVVDKDRTEEEEKEKDKEDEDRDDDGLGSGDLGLGRLLSSSRGQEKEKQGGPSSPILGEHGRSSSRGRSSGRGRGNGGEAEVEGNVNERVELPGPLMNARLQRAFQTGVHASTPPQDARGGNRVVGAAERNKENQRHRTTGAGTGAGTREDSLPRPTRKEKGKWKEVVEPAPAPAPAPAPRSRPTSTLAPRAFHGQASSSSSASTIPNTTPPPKNKGKGKVKAKGASLLEPPSRADLVALIASTAPRPIPDRPEPTPAQPTDTGNGMDDVVVETTTPIPLPGYAQPSRAGRGIDGDGTEVHGEREGVVDGDGDGDSVEYGSRVLRSASASAWEAREVNQTAGESSRTGSRTGSNANVTPSRKRARIDIGDLLLYPVESRPQSQPRPLPQARPHLLPQSHEEDDSSPVKKRQRTGNRGGKGGEGSNVNKKRKRS